MKLVITFKPSTGELETFRYDEPGPLPPVIASPEPDEPRDAGPPVVKENARTFNRRGRKKENLNKPS